MSQNQIFSSGEGDAWFNRNAKQLLTVDQASQSEDVQYLCKTLKPFKDEINQVLEIGCSNGIKLESICHQLNAVGIGVDPSIHAVDSGNARKKIADVTLKVGDGNNLPFESSSFNVVYFAFCLYLFDRESLIQSMAEADRVLKPGGFLVITDFDPGSQYRRSYTHHEGVFSYKQNYAAFFIQSGLYYLAGKNCFSHSKSTFEVSVDERVSTSILFKETNPYPIID